MQISDFLLNTLIALLAILVSIIGVFYTRGSYLSGLKIYEKDKSHSEKAHYYYQTYINVAPSAKRDSFLKKIDSDALNDGVLISPKFTDYLIKHHPERYFYAASLLKKSYKYFEINASGMLVHQLNHSIKKQVLLLILYFVLVMLGSILFLFNAKILSNISEPYFWPSLFIIFFIILGFITFGFLALNQSTKISEARQLIKELNISHK